MFWLAQIYAMVFDTQYSTKMIFEHNKFQTMCSGATQPLILDKWNIVVLMIPIFSLIFYPRVIGLPHLGHFCW